MASESGMVQIGDAFLEPDAHGSVRQGGGFHCIQFTLSRFCLEHGLRDYEQILRSHEFDTIPALASISREDLEAMGITKLGAQRKIELGLKALRTRYGELFQETFGDAPQKAVRRSTKQAKPEDSRVPRTSSGRTHPRCRQGCCMYIVRSADGSKHKCDPARIGHSWADCPTKNEKAPYHAEEVALERANKKLMTPSKRRSSSVDRGKGGPVAFAQAKKRQKLTKAPGWEEYREEMLHVLREKLPGMFVGLQADHSLVQAADLALAKQYSELTQKYLQLKTEKGPYSRHVRKDTVMEAVEELLGLNRNQVVEELVDEIGSNKNVGLLPGDALQPERQATPGTEQHIYVQQHMDDVMGLPVPPQLAGDKGLHSIVHDI